MVDSRRGWTRREFLKLAGKAGLLSAAPGFAGAAAAFDRETVCLSILHTTDIHGHILPTSDYDGNADRGGLARCVTQIRRWRHENPDSILIDAGDVYQGTDVSLRTRGELMIDLFNCLGYDAWVVGNHEFDWGMDCFQSALQRSAMPVLGANMLLEGKPAGEFADPKHPLAKIQPFILKEIGGIKLAIVGVTTPGMTYWLPREFTRGLDFQNPVEPVRRAIAQARSEGANAVVLAGHMGLKPRTGGDDFANSVMALTTEFQETAVFIGGHTHQAIPSRLTNGVLFTQADHFGIHAGRVDLLFDRDSKRLIGRRASCQLMDDRFPLDPVVISRAKSHLGESQNALAQPIGELAETLRAQARRGEPSELENLIGAAVKEALQERNVPVDGVMHGVFDENASLAAGRVTVRDIWNVLPYENYIVTAQLTGEEIQAVMQEVCSGSERRSLPGFNIQSEGRGAHCRIIAITQADGRPLDRGKKYVIAFNSFDARSAGHHFMRLRALLERPAASCTMHPVQIRDAVIGYFLRHKIVGRVTQRHSLPLAA